MNKKPMIYIAGDMLTVGSQMLRAKERNDIQALGLPFYNPADNKEINDKANAVQEGLAERIVRQDSEAIYESDVLVIEPQPFALGTMTELGQVKGRRDLANEINDILVEGDGEEDWVTLGRIEELVDRVRGQKIYPHYQDIRRFEGVTESEDRRSLGINQYVYGVCLDLTDGKGFYEWNEILEELEGVSND